MDELDVITKGNDTEFYLGTVSAVSATGLKIQLDGQSSAMEKKYKVLKNGKPLVAGDRIIVMKTSGTYVVLGELSYPTTRTAISDLPTSATATVIALRFNSLLTALRTQGIIG